MFVSSYCYWIYSEDFFPLFSIISTPKTGFSGLGRGKKGVLSMRFGKKGPLRICTLSVLVPTACGTAATLPSRRDASPVLQRDAPMIFSRYLKPQGANP